MSGSGGVDLTANGIGHQTTDRGRGVVGACIAETVSQVPGKSITMNGPETGLNYHKRIAFEKDDGSTAVRKCREHLSGPRDGQSQTQSHGQSGPVLSTDETVEQKNEHFVNDKICSCDDAICDDLHLEIRSDVSGCEHVDGIHTDSSAKILQLKSKINMTKTSDAATAGKHEGLTNGCCYCHAKGAALNTISQESVVSSDAEQSEILSTAANGPRDHLLGKLSCNCARTGIGEPLSDLTQMVESVCLDDESSRDVKCTASAAETCKPETATPSPPCEDGAACRDLLGGIDQPFGIMGPAGADLAGAELEELPSSLSDFVLGCPGDQYAVPPCPENDSDINTIHIQGPAGADKHPVTLVPYKSEVQMPDIMRLITKDLSEPYSIYTYRYFIHNWPQLCFLAMHLDKCVGAIVCKLDVHKKMARRGYIAMLAVDENYRKLQIGSSLVKKAIRAMVRGECDEVVLETEITNKPALKLYENLGFLRDKRLFRYYLNGVDALRLKLWLR